MIRGLPTPQKIARPSASAMQEVLRGARELPSQPAPPTPRHAAGQYPLPSPCRHDHLVPRLVATSREVVSQCSPVPAQPARQAEPQLVPLLEAPQRPQWS
jgi:hypothetical protein